MTSNSSYSYNNMLSWLVLLLLIYLVTLIKTNSAFQLCHKNNKISSIEQTSPFMRRRSMTITTTTIPSSTKSAVAKLTTTPTTLQSNVFDKLLEPKYDFFFQPNQQQPSKGDILLEASNANFRNQEMKQIGLSAATTTSIRNKVRQYILKIIQHIKNSYRNTIVRRKILISTMLLLSLSFTNNIIGIDSAAAASTGGRMGGGSFSRSLSSPSYSRPSGRSFSSPSSSSSSSLSFKKRPTTTNYKYNNYNINRYDFNPTTRTILFPSSVRTTTAPNRIIVNGLLLIGVANILFYVVHVNRHHDYDPYDSNTGSKNTYGTAVPGATIASIKLSFDVPNRDDPNSILARLKRISTTANTSSNQGLKDLVTSVTVELTRQQSSMNSAFVSGQYYPTTSKAEREFRILSVKEQSNVDRLTVNKFQGENRPDDTITQFNSDGTTTSTIAVVTVNIAMRGKFIGPTNKKGGSKNNFSNNLNRLDVISLLTQIGSDVQMEDNEMIAAEIFWTPEQRDDILTQEEVYYKYPELLPL